MQWLFFASLEIVPLTYCIISAQSNIHLSVGAGSPIIEEAIRKVSAGLGSGADSPDLYAQTIAKSFFLSIDQAHAVHPNYASKHEAQHSPKINAGLVIKTNQNQRYATNGVTGFVVRELARMSDLPIQEFCVRNDCPCGSTIGPTISTRTGVRTIDAGMPQLSMHSCREVMGIADCKLHGCHLLLKHLIAWVLIFTNAATFICMDYIPYPYVISDPRGGSVQVLFQKLPCNRRKNGVVSQASSETKSEISLVLSYLSIFSMISKGTLPIFASITQSHFRRSFETATMAFRSILRYQFFKNSEGRDLVECEGVVTQQNRTRFRAG